MSRDGGSCTCMPVSCVLLSQEEAGEGSPGQTGDKLESRGIRCTFALALCRSKEGRGGWQRTMVLAEAGGVS